MSVTLNHFAETQVSIDAGGIVLNGDLVIPPRPKGIVLFAHGSGSSRHSPRNRMVAAELHEGGFATLLMDLLTEPEESIDEKTATLRFDIRMLGDRLLGATRWVERQLSLANLPIGYFGASTGAGAAMVAAALRPRNLRAVVSRGGRPDLARQALPLVAVPTLLIVGGDDYAVIEMNQDALNRLKCQKELAIVSGATHLFEEPGTLQEVARLARDWFDQHLPPVSRHTEPD